MALDRFETFKLRYWPTRVDPGIQQIPNHRDSDAEIKRKQTIHELRENVYFETKSYKLWASMAVIGTGLTAYRWPMMHPVRRRIIAMSVNGWFAIKAHFSLQIIKDTDTDTALTQLEFLDSK